MVAIDGWPKHSRYPNVSWKCTIRGGKRYTSIIATLRKTEGRACLVLPDCQGHFVRSLGKAGEKDTEQEVLLLEHDVPHQPFSQAVLSFLPKMPWAITPEVVKTTYSTIAYSMFTSGLWACSLASHHCVYLWMLISGPGEAGGPEASDGVQRGPSWLYRYRWCSAL